MPHSIKHFKLIDQARRIKVLAFFISIAILFSWGCSFDDDTGEYEPQTANKLQRARVIKIKDGDSVILRFEDSTEKEARLFGIDAPEYNQPFGREAKAILSKLLYKKMVFVESRGTDRYQREIVILNIDKHSASINQLMIESGAAWVYSRYQDDKTWLMAQKTAKRKSLGLWVNSSAIAPWLWRNKKAPSKK